MEHAAVQSPPAILIVDTECQDESQSGAQAAHGANGSSAGNTDSETHCATDGAASETNHNDVPNGQSQTDNAPTNRAHQFGESAGLKVANAIQEARREAEIEPLPVVFIAARGDIHAPLQAVRAGGAAYFTRPVDAAEVIDMLDTLTPSEAPDPDRILIMGDEPSLVLFTPGYCKAPA